MNRLSRYCDGLMEAVWLLAVIYVSLYFPLSLEQPYSIGKTAIFRTLVLIGLAAWAVRGMGGFSRLSISGMRAKAASQPLLLLVGALAMVYTVSTAFSIAPLVSLRGSYSRFEGLPTLLSYLLMFALLAANLRRREQVDRLVTTIAAVSFAVDLYAIMQRLGPDPVAWDFPIHQRSISTIGHPIFLAAFLGMSLMLMLGRSVYLVRLIQQKASQGAAAPVLVAAYLIVSALNLLAIWFAVARGPLIALLVGMLFLGFLMLAYWQLRRTFYVFAVLGVMILTFIAVLNINNGPLSGMRDTPLVGPLGHAFNAQTGTGRTRVMIWNGVMRLVTPHDPIQVGTTGDRWNAIRPLVGYGPETLSIVYEDFYLPEMFAVERYDLEHEHAHNEFWDVLAHYGILGFFVEYGFFLCLIYFALKWLGWISSGREVRVYWLASLLGGLFGGIAAWAFAGTEFLGLGIPLGLLLGAVATLLLRMLRNDSITVVKPDLWRDMLLVSSLAMVIFHYVEILFGISVQTSRVFFWIVCGMMLALGQGSLAESRDLKEMPRIGLHAGIVTAILMALIPLFTVLHDFGQDILTIIVNALAFNSFSILWMFLGIALFSSLLFELGDAVIAGRKFSFKSLAWLLGIVFFISALVWMLYASQLALIWKSPDLRPLQVVALYVRMLTAQFVALVVFAYAAAFLFSDTSGAPVTNPKPLVAAGFVLAQVLALALSFYINLRPFQANGIAGLFNNYVKYNQYPAAIEVSGEILKLDPSQDIYYTSVADAAMEYAGMLAGRQNVTGYVLMAEERAKRAYNLNPLYYRNRMVMAKVNRVWARITPDPAARKVRIDQAEKFYADFLESRPYRVKLWVEWADFRAEFDDMQGARQKVDAALKIDKTYTLAYMVSANLYLKAADKQESPAKRAELWKLALTDLQMQIQTTRSEDNPAFAWLQLGDVHVLLQQDEQARDAYLQAEQLGLGNFQWEVYKKLAEVSGRLNDTAAQRGYLQQAIAAAPAEEVAGLQSVLDSLKP